jgi:hypothetical protein
LALLKLLTRSEACQVPSFEEMMDSNENIVECFHSSLHLMSPLSMASEEVLEVKLERSLSKVGSSCQIHTTAHKIISPLLL